GVVLTELGRLKEANEAYNRALSLTADFLPARKNRAVNAFSLGEYRFAESEFEALVKLTPKDFVPHLFLGLLAMEQSQWSSARPHLLEAKRLSPNSARVLLALTRVHFAMGKRSLALESVREMRAGSRRTAAERFELGVLLAQFESPAEAAEVFQELWLNERSSYNVGFNLALVYYRAGRLEAALAIVKELESRAIPSAELFNLRGWIYNKMNRLDQARDSLEQALKADPGNPDHYLDLSTILSNQGETEMAIQVIAKGLQHRVEKNRLQVQMGLLYEKSHDYGEAERWYQTALKTEGTTTPAYVALARLMLATERRKQALDLLADATRFLPNDPLLAYMYGAELLDTTRDSDPEQLERAESVLLKALELNPFYANTHYMLGRLYLKRGDDQTARNYFEKACAFNPKHTDAYYQRLRIAVQRGEKDKISELSEIVRRLHDQEKNQIQETVTGVVEESLRASPEGILLTRSTN
ncbi:MAG TPA: tetratricopeptide repeat protein, partial [Terriglobia bacterium]|nr:tetratricopeptide repeat protein [Terriglobia bacterium]